MDIPLWIVVPATLALVALGLFIAYKIEGAKENAVERFGGDFVDAIKHSQPTWEQVLDMADLAGVPAQRAYRVARILQKRLLTGADPHKLAEHKSLIDSYIARHRASEPFEGLPNEVRIHLERISDQHPEARSSLMPLTQQIRDLVAIHGQEFKRQKRYASWGFTLGIVGLVFAAYAYFFPYAPQQKAITPVSPGASSPATG